MLVEHGQPRAASPAIRRAGLMGRLPAQPGTEPYSLGNGDGQSLKSPSTGYPQPGAIALSFITAGHRTPGSSMHRTLPAVSYRRKDAIVT
jgi:hypothetical protein